MINFDGRQLFFCSFCQSKNLKIIGNVAYSIDKLKNISSSSTSSNPILVKCKSCHSRFVVGGRSKNLALKNYREESSAEKWNESHFEDSRPVEHSQVLLNYLKGSASLLDVGANTGLLLDYVAKDTSFCAAVEPSIASQEILKAKGYRVYSDIADVNMHFDLITCFDVLEHIYEVQIFLDKLYDRLNQHGYVIILTGNPNSISAKFSRSRWWYATYPEHISFVSKKYLRSLKKFDLVYNLGTFADNHYNSNFKYKLKKLVLNKEILNYTGRPAITKDHQIYVLRKKFCD